MTVTMRWALTLILGASRMTVESSVWCPGKKGVDTIPKVCYTLDSQKKGDKKMTVKELIEALKNFDENEKVLINIYDEDSGHWDYDEVSEVFDPAGDGRPMIL